MPEKEKRSLFGCLKGMFACDNMEQKKRHPSWFCQTLDSLGPEEGNSITVTPNILGRGYHCPQPEMAQCPPTTIVTSDGETIPPRFYDIDEDYTEDMCGDPTMTSATQTTPQANRSSYSTYKNNNNSGRRVSRMVQVPSYRCLITPRGTVSDSFLPEKVLRIRRKIRHQQERSMERQRARVEGQRQRRQLIRHCTSPSSSYQSIATSAYPSDATLNCGAHLAGRMKYRGRKNYGVLLRSGKQLKQVRPWIKCGCCCCSRNFCHHRTEYTKGSRNPSCESIASSLYK